MQGRITAHNGTKQMAEATVYFSAVQDGEDVASIGQKAARLAAAAGFAEVVSPSRPCAIKQHFGERDNAGYIKPTVTKAVVDWVKAVGGQPFVTDTNTLYRGRRGQTIDHLEMAREHGFDYSALGAPVIIADGLLGADQVTVPIEGGTHFRDVRIASAGYQAASCIVLTHVKGHCQSGMAGAVKNIGMGFAARAGKLAQHHEGHPNFDSAKCRACGVCARWCPVDAITLQDAAELEADACIGCGECLAVCPHDAIGFSWGVAGPVLIERMCEHVLGFLSNKQGRVGYLNFLIDVTRNCDCVGRAQETEYPNVGILASTDIVAVEAATVDVSCSAYGKDIWLDWWPGSNYRAQLDYGEKLGLGTQAYELIEV